ncbi:biopolymer transporter ExbD [Parasulfuritortus cantonensis]|uniref:Biopolymer transporter ExbD n=1 Tax=Parasulfuritortus cantonensis TaxID=2528202 RepID=A0A4R1BDI8_9PROT|nr:biopolymer transporter ExbD [Parasulfuritortus cantonensis]TCJ15104.1 biopolymer transporter ExbD [Parasulfuritortus cantonensis]
MAFGGFEQGGHQAPMAEINTTPLVDVMLVLLVIFIITAPLFNQAVPIDLPKVSASNVEDKPFILRVALDADEQLYLDDAPISFAELNRRFQAAVVEQHIPELRLRADRHTEFEAVARILAAAQYAGLSRIAFVTDPANQASH